MPPPLKEGGHIDLPLSVCPSVRLSFRHSVRPEKFVSRVSLKAFDIQTWNFLNVLLRVGTCAPGYFHPAKIYIYGVMALDLVKKRHFKLVSSITLKVFVVQTWNFMDVLFRVWTCAPGYFHPAKIYIFTELWALIMWKSGIFSLCRP